MRPHAAGRTLTVKRTVAPSRASMSMIGAEEVYTPSEEIADAELRHAQSLGSRLLFETANHDEFLYLDHEIRPAQQMFGLLTAKSQVTEHISG